MTIDFHCPNCGATIRPPPLPLEFETTQPTKVSQLHLRDCPVCNGPVSTDADLCPKCGHPFPRPSRFGHKTPRGWAMPVAIWLTVAICASTFQGCATLIAASVQLIGETQQKIGETQQKSTANFLKLAPDSFQPIQETQQKSTGEVRGKLAGFLPSLIGIGIHWLLNWRRRINLPLPTNRYWVWTGLHIAWTGLALLGVLFTLAVLPMAYSNASNLFVQMADPGAQMKVLLLTMSTILFALAAAGWVLIVIAVPPTKTGHSAQRHT